MRACEVENQTKTYPDSGTLLRTPPNSPLRSLEVLKLEDTCVIPRQIFVRVPGTRAE